MYFAPVRVRLAIKKSVLQTSQFRLWLDEYSSTVDGVQNFETHSFFDKITSNPIVCKIIQTLQNHTKLYKTLKNFTKPSKTLQYLLAIENTLYLLSFSNLSKT